MAGVDDQMNHLVISAFADELEKQAKYGKLLALGGGLLAGAAGLSALRTRRKNIPAQSAAVREYYERQQKMRMGDKPSSQPSIGSHTSDGFPVLAPGEGVGSINRGAGLSGEGRW